MTGDGPMTGPGATGEDGRHSGARLGSFLLGGLLGRGAMGEVYDATDESTGRHVAVKLLHRELSRAPKAGHRFRREAEAAKRVQHEGVVEVVDFGEAPDGALFLAMELLPQRTLADVLKEHGRLAVPDVLSLARELLVVLDHVHAQGIVHRDLKPANICVLEPPARRLKVLDFGIARLVQEDDEWTRLTTQGKVLGTPSYLAPETIRGEPVTPAADLYAVGVILYRALAGSLPFRGPDVLSVIKGHLETPAPALPNDVPEGLRTLVARLLAKRPGERPANAGAAAALLPAPTAADDPVPVGDSSAGGATVRMGAPSEAAAAPGLRAGEVLAGRYRVDAFIARGGMGSVYRGTHLSLGRPVALKLMHPEYTRDDGMVERFRREALLGARVNAENVVHVYDVESLPDGRLVVVTELADGGSLKDRLTTAGRLSPKEALTIALGVCHGLARAHAAGAIHRDLKPDNVVFTGDVPKIIDFGIAKLAEESTKLTATGAVIGTPRYMAPEQATGGEPTPATDLYAVGVMLYEMLSGVTPHTGKNLSSLLYQKVNEPPEPLERKLAGGIDPRIAALVSELLTVSQADRPGSAVAVAETIQSILAAPAGRAAATSPRAVDERGERAGRAGRAGERPSDETGLSAAPGPAGGRRVPSFVRVGVAAAVIGAAVLAFLLWPKGDPAPPAAPPNPVAVAPAVPAGRDAGGRAAPASPTRDAASTPSDVPTSDVPPPAPDERAAAAVATPDAAPQPGGGGPTPAVAPTQARQDVEIVALPVPADLYLDGARIGRTPFAVHLSPEASALRLELRAEGYAPREVVLDLAKLRLTRIPRLEYTLEPERPGGAPGAADGREAGPRDPTAKDPAAKDPAAKDPATKNPGHPSDMVD